MPVPVAPVLFAQHPRAPPRRWRQHLRANAHRALLRIAAVALTAVAWFMPTGATRHAISSEATAQATARIPAPIKTALTGWSGGEVAQMVLTQADLEKLDFLLDPLAYYGGFWCPAWQTQCYPSQMKALAARGYTDVDNPDDSTLTMGFRRGAGAFGRIDYERSMPTGGNPMVSSQGDGLGSAGFGSRLGVGPDITQHLGQGGLMEPYRFALKKIAGPLVLLFMLLNFGTVLVVGAMGGGSVGLDKVVQQTVFRTFITLAFLNFHPLYHVLFEGVSTRLINALTTQIRPQAMARGAARMGYLVILQTTMTQTGTAVRPARDTMFVNRYRNFIENNRAYPGEAGGPWSGDELAQAQGAISFIGVTAYAACNMDIASRRVDQGGNASTELNPMLNPTANNRCQQNLAKGFGAPANSSMPNSGGRMLWEALASAANAVANPTATIQRLGNAVANSLLFIIVWIAQLILAIVVWCIMLAVVFVKNMSLVFAPLAMTFYMWQKTEGLALDWFKGHMTILLLTPMLAFTLGMASVLMWLMSETGASQGLFLSFVMIIGVVALAWKTKDIAATFGTNLFTVISSTAGAITGAVSVAAGTALTGGLAAGKVALGASTGGLKAGSMALQAARNANGTGGLASARNAMAAARGAVGGAARGGISTVLDGNKMKDSIKAGQKFRGAAKQALDVNNPGIVPNYAEFATAGIEAAQKMKAKREQKKQDKQKNPDNGTAANFDVKGGSGKVPAKPSEIMNEQGENQFDAEAKRLGVDGKAVDAAKVFADRAAANGMAHEGNWEAVHDKNTNQTKVVATAQGNAKHERLINPASAEYDEDYAWASAALAAAEGAGKEADPINDPHLMKFAGESRGGSKAPGWAVGALGASGPRKASFGDLISHGKGAAVALSAATAIKGAQQAERQRQTQRANEAGTLLEQGSLSDITVRSSADNVTRNHGDPKAQQRVFNALTDDDNIRATVEAFMDDPNGNQVGQQKLKSMNKAQLNQFITDAKHNGQAVQQVDGLADFAADYAATASRRAAIKVDAEVLVNRDGQFGLDVARQVGQNRQPIYTAQSGSTLDGEWQRRGIRRADHAAKAAVVDQMRDAMASAYGKTYDRVAADVRKQINEQLFLVTRGTP